MLLHLAQHSTGPGSFERGKIAFNTTLTHGFFYLPSTGPQRGDFGRSAEIQDHKVGGDQIHSAHLRCGSPAFRQVLLLSFEHGDSQHTRPRRKVVVPGQLGHLLSRWQIHKPMASHLLTISIVKTEQVLTEIHHIDQAMKTQTAVIEHLKKRSLNYAQYLQSENLTILLSHPICRLSWQDLIPQKSMARMSLRNKSGLRKNANCNRCMSVKN